MSGTRRLGKIISPETGEVLVEMFGPRNAISGDADLVSSSLYSLSELLVRGLLPDERGGGLGGDFGYGCDYENEVFLMHHYCWCEKNDGSCLWCLHGDHPDFYRLLNERFGTTEETYYDKHSHYFDPPHFWHKASDVRIRWYKWISRDMAMNRDITSKEWVNIWNECLLSIPEQARRKAQEDHDRENTPEAKRERASNLRLP